MDIRFFHEQLQFSRSFRKELNERLKEIGLFHTQWLVLYCINLKESTTLVEISNYLDVEKPTISRTVKRLEEQGFIEALPSDDKRERRISLSQKGQMSFEKGYQIVTEYEARLIDNISENDLAVTLQTIQKLKMRLSGRGM